MHGLPRPSPISQAPERAKGDRGLTVSLGNLGQLPTSTVHEALERSLNGHQLGPL